MNESLKVTNCIEKDKWSEFAYNHPHGNIFQTAEMAEVYKRTKNYEPITLAAIDTKRVDIPVYLCAGDNKLRLRVYAKEAVKELSVRVYFDDIEIKRINELVKFDEGVRVRRYGW